MIKFDGEIMITIDSEDKVAFKQISLTFDEMVALRNALNEKFRYWSKPSRSHGNEGDMIWVGDLMKKRDEEN